MIICIEHPSSPYHFPLALLEPIELYYYKTPNFNLVSNSTSSMKLKFGDNYLDDENIVLSNVGVCYSLTPKPLGTYRHKKQERRFVKIVFPNDETLITGIDDWTYYDIFYWYALHVFFTHEDNALSLGMGGHLQRGEVFEAKMIRQFDIDVMTSIELKTKKTNYIKEKTSCADERITLESLGPVLGPDLAQAVEKSCQCYPEEFPFEFINPGGHICLDYFWGISCFKDVWKNFVKEKSKLKPCTKFEYAGNFALKHLDFVADKRILLGDNVIDKKINFLVEYHFQQPEFLLLTEEYYVVPTLDLIGLIRGTLGMFIGFSFYGTFADALSLALSIAKKIAGKNFFLSPVGDFTHDYMFLRNLSKCLKRKSNWT